MADTQPQSEDGSPQLLRRTVIKLTAAGAATAVAGSSVTGSAAAQSGEAEIVIPAQTTYGFEIEIESATLPDGGFVALVDPVNPHEKDWPHVGQTMPSEEEIIDSQTIGTTGYLEPGTHEGLMIELDEPLDFDHNTVEEFTGKLYQVWMHRDTDDNEEFTNVAPGEEDNRYGYQNEGQAPTESDEIVIGEAYLEHATFNPNTVETQIAENENRISEIDSQISDLESQVSDLESTDEDHEERISQLEEERSTLQSEVEDLRSRVSSLEEQAEETPTPTATETSTDSPGFGIVTTIAGAALGAAAAAKRFGGGGDDDGSDE